jgi:hypothetical protein
MIKKHKLVTRTIRLPAEMWHKVDKLASSSMISRNTAIWYIIMSFLTSKTSFQFYNPKLKNEK